MVCEDCSKSTTGLAAPDAWRAGGRDLTKAGENKLLKKGVRSNPYGNCCTICKMKVQISNASYCTPCAYGRGICAVCGKQVLDTTMYKMSEGGVGLHKTGSKDEAKFKSPEQIAREKAQADLYTYLQQTGQDGKMPTKAALEAAGHRDLAAALIASFGGLHAAANSMGLSTRLLSEEAEARAQAKREAAVRAAEEDAERRAAAETAAAEAALVGSAPVADGGAAADDDDDDDGGDAPPPGIALPTSEAAAPQHMPAAPPSKLVPPPPPASTDPRWQYDPNVGLYFQLSTQTYYDHGKRKYFQSGQWMDRPPARGW